MENPKSGVDKIIIYKDILQIFYRIPVPFGVVLL